MCHAAVILTVVKRFLRGLGSSAHQRRFALQNSVKLARRAEVNPLGNRPPPKMAAHQRRFALQNSVKLARRAEVNPLGNRPPPKMAAQQRGFALLNSVKLCVGTENQLTASRLF